MEENIIQEQLTEIQSQPTKPWLKIALLAVLGLVLAGGLVFAGVQIGKRQGQSQLPVYPTFPPQAVASPTSVAVVIPTQISTLTSTPSPTPTLDPTTGWKTYTNIKNKFSFRYPDYFKYLSENPDGNGVYLAPREGIGEGRGSPFGLDLTKDSWLSATATKLDSASFQYWEDKLSDSNITVDGVRGYKEQVWPKAASEPAYGYSVSILKETTLYKLGLLAGNEQIGFLSERQDMFDLILSTFRFLD